MAEEKTAVEAENRPRYGLGRQNCQRFGGENTVLHNCFQREPCTRGRLRRKGDGGRCFPRTERGILFLSAG